MKRSSHRFAVLVTTALLVVVVALGLAGGGRSGARTETAGVLYRSAPARADGPAIFRHRAKDDDKPRVLLFTAIPATLPATGGVVRLDAVVANATRCRFSAAEKLRPLPQSDHCSSGSAAVTLDIAHNTAASARTYSFALSISGKRGAITAPRVKVRESAAPGAQPPAGATSPTTTSSVVPTPPSPISAAPAITAEPTSETVGAGETASFTAAAAGSPAPSVQWEQSTDGAGTDWSPVSGATAPTYSFSASAADNGYEYEAVFTNIAGSATTAPATLTIGSAPQVTTQPSSATVVAGADASFTAAASGSPAPAVQWQVSIDGGSWGDVAGATGDTYEFATIGNENGYEYRAVFTNAVNQADSNAVKLTLTDETTGNWSGYVVAGEETYSEVTGAWSVPTLDCSLSNATAYSAHWIGIDGYASATVEQDGSEADCSGGTASYDAWYELYGDDAVDGGDEVELSRTQYPVKPGDSISASVSVSDDQWTLTLADSSEPWTYSTQVAFSGAAQSSAEWIGERPELCGGGSCEFTSLADFGTLGFTSATASAGGTTGPISAFPYYPLEMTGNSGDELAAPGPLDPSGDGFTDTWHASS